MSLYVKVGARQAQIDDEDLELVSGYTWHVSTPRGSKTSYACSRSNGGGHTSMHGLIMQSGSGIVDHINGDGLDNRRCNLRPSNRQRNALNSGKKKHNTSGYKGVTWKKDKKKFKAYMVLNGTQVHLGYYDDPVVAALAYDKAMREWAGEHGRYNFE